MTVSIPDRVFSDTKPCSLVDRYQRYEGTCCLHVQDIRPEGATLMMEAADCSEI
jgi:hypothetical protein